MRYSATLTTKRLVECAVCVCVCGGGGGREEEWEALEFLYLVLSAQIPPVLLEVLEKTQVQNEHSACLIPRPFLIVWE